MTTYRTHDKVITAAGSKATFQWTLPDGKCEVWVTRADWQEPDPYPYTGNTAPLIVPVDSLKPQHAGVRK